MTALTEKLIGIGWGPSRLAGKLGIKPQAVSQWEEVPPRRAPMVAKLTGLSIKELSPSAFDVEERQS